MPTPEFYKQLVDRYKNNQASDEELRVFFQLLEEGKLADYLDEAMRRDIDAIVNERPGLLKRLPAWAKMSAAAALLLLIAGSYFLFFKSTKPAQDMARQTRKQQFKNDLPPGGDRATLTLADGSVIILDSAKNGRLTDQGSATILKVNDGQLAYDAVPKEDEPVVYNTLSTPKGGQYKVTLPDGSKVWLNAASSLRYPTSFKGNERLVELTGEVYFEVARDITKPFIVRAAKMDVKVLGTHFNVNSYPDEPVTAITLTEGSISVKAGNHTKTIVPGEQATIDVAGNLSVREVDTDLYTAWKDGYFRWKDENITTIMRQVARWYNIDYTIDNSIKNESFGGIVARKDSISRVIRIMEATSTIHFKKEESKIIVTK